MHSNGHSVESLLIADREAAALCGVSRATWHRLRAAGKLPPSLRIARCVKWRRADVELWILLGCPDRATFEAALNQQRRLRVS